MTKSLFIKRSFFLFVLAATFFACKKTNTITLREPGACFSTYVQEPYSFFNFLGTTALIDSNFYFLSCSDSGAAITYHWSFGDGAESTEKNPKHSYSKRGNYTVTLEVSNNKQAFDTLQRTVSVILGQKHISFGDGTYTYPLAIEETPNNEFELLASNNFYSTYYLIQLDSLLKQKSIKTFPAKYSFTNMQSTSDGNYIFTGSTVSLNKANELIKMTADGTQLWSKTLSANDSYSYVTQTPDGGYAITGSRQVTGPFGNNMYATVVIKTDNNGNLQWQKLLNQEGMTDTKDLVVEADGITVAGVKRDVTGNCQYCDTLLIVKLNNSGNVTWSNTVAWGLNTSNWWNTRISKLTSGNYAVTNEYTGAIFYFSPSGSFVDRKILPYQVLSIVNTADANIIALQSESGNGNRINVSKFTLEAVQQWYANPDGRQKVSGGGYSCCSSSWPTAIHPLRKGGYIFTGYRVDNNSTGNGNNYAVLMLELDENGKPK